MPLPHLRHVLALLATAALTLAHGAESTALNLCDAEPSFNEDFTAFRVASRALGEARWTSHTPWNGDFGDAAFADPGPSGPFTMADGELHITASRTPEGRWRSGLIAAADASGRGYGARYGYFEARMRMPPGRSGLTRPI